MHNNSENIIRLQENGWTSLIQPPSDPINPKTLLLIHGWTGDENSMWIFARRIPQNYWIISLRGPIQAPFGGYGWIKHDSGIWPDLSDFKIPARNLKLQVDFLREHLSIPTNSINLMGFSQGAAMAYALSVLYPDWSAKTAALSSFLPNLPSDILANASLLRGHSFLITHGTQDNVIPVEKAHEANHNLSILGAEVILCEEETEHKLGHLCFKQLEIFFSNAV